MAELKYRALGYIRNSPENSFRKLSDIAIILNFKVKFEMRPCDET